MHTDALKQHGEILNESKPLPVVEPSSTTSSNELVIPDGFVKKKGVPMSKENLQKHSKHPLFNKFYNKDGSLIGIREIIDVDVKSITPKDKAQWIKNVENQNHNTFLAMRAYNEMNGHQDSAMTTFLNLNQHSTYWQYKNDDMLGVKRVGIWSGIMGIGFLASKVVSRLISKTKEMKNEY